MSLKIQDVSLQNLTVLPTKFFHQCKIYISSVINLLMQTPTEIIRRGIFRR